MNNITAEARLEQALEQVRDLAWNAEFDHDGITHSTDHDGNHILTAGHEQFVFCLDTDEATTDEDGTALDWGYTWVTYTADVDSHGEQVGWDSLDIGGSVAFEALEAAVTNWIKQQAA